MPSSVFVVQDMPRLDFVAAREYGDKLIAVFPPGQVQLSPHIAVAQARKVLRDLTRDDWLLLVGDPVMIGICVAVAAEMIGRARLLRFNRHTFTYTPIEVDFLERHPAPV